MKPTETVEHLARLGPQDLAVTLQQLADQVYKATLTNTRQPIRDAADFKQWLEELATAAHAKRLGLAETTPPAQKRWA